jgi:hypothetical protein
MDELYISPQDAIDNKIEEIKEHYYSQLITIDKKSEE